MAYRPRRSPPRRTSSSRRTYRTGSRVSRSRTSSRSSVRNRSSRGQQTVKIVVETMPATQLSRPDGPLQVPAAPPKRSKF